MSSSKFATPLQLELTVSKTLVYLLLVLYLAAFIIVCLLDIHLLIKLLLAVLLVLNAKHALYKHALFKSADAITTLVWQEEDWLLIKRNNAVEHDCVLLNGFYNRFCIFLNFRTSPPSTDKPKTIPVLLLFNMLQQQDYYQLLTRLRFNKL